MRTLAESLARNAHVTPSAPCLSDADRSMNFHDVDIEVNRLCHGLMSAGCRPGDTVAICARNSVEYLLLLHAASRIDLHLVTLNYWLRATELVSLLRHCGATWLALDADTAEVLADAVVEVPELDPSHVMVLDHGSGSGPSAFPEATPLSALLAGSSSNHPDVVTDDDAPLWTMYTSGTTGHPKGAVRSQRRAMDCTVFGTVEFGFTPADRFLAVSPFFHGVTFLPLMVLVRGGSVHVAARFDAGEAARVLTDESITATFMVPTMVTALLDVIAETRRKADDLRVLVTGGAPVPGALRARTTELLGNVLYEFYGSTESGFVTVLHPDDATEEPSSGRPCFGAQVEIRDDHGAVVPPGQVGELFSRCDGRFDHYLDQPEETAAALRDGWFTAGDLARCDAEGRVQLVDRKKDLIISGGENVYPRDIEECLLRHPAVAECAVIGVPDPRWGEAVRAFVVLTTGATATSDELVEHCSQHLAGFKRPREVVVIDQLPRNATGKIVKTSLRTNKQPDSPTE